MLTRSRFSTLDHRRSHRDAHGINVPFLVYNLPLILMFQCSVMDNTQSCPYLDEVLPPGYLNIGRLRYSDDSFEEETSRYFA